MMGITEYFEMGIDLATWPFLKSTGAYSGDVPFVKSSICQLSGLATCYLDMDFKKYNDRGSIQFLNLTGDISVMDM